MSETRRKKIMLGYAGVCYVYLYLNMLKSRSSRSVWVKNWKYDKNTFSHLPLLKELRNKDPEDFRNYLRIDDLQSAGAHRCNRY